jgi:hypothetical protein
VDAATILGAIGTGVAVVSLAATLRERQQRREQFGLLKREAVDRLWANVVVDRHEATVDGATVTHLFVVLNAGPTVARDVDVELLVEGEHFPFRMIIGSAHVSMAMVAGDRREAEITVPLREIEDRDVAVHASWEDGYGIQGRDLMLFLSGDPLGEDAIPIPEQYDRAGGTS